MITMNSDRLLLVTCLLIASAGSARAAAQPAAAFGKLPLSFEPNRGQADRRAQFVSHGPGYTLYLAPGEALLTGGADVLDMRLVGANPAAAARGLDLQPGVVNYLAGNDPSKWHSRIPTYGKVDYDAIYPGIDLVFYGNQRQLEYDFVVAPGADPHRIAWNIAGASLKVDPDGNLLLQSAHSPASFQKPFIYQMVNGRKVAIAGRYAISGHGVRFALGKYDHAQPLVIDPVLSWATYLGGAVNQYSATDGYSTIGGMTSFYPSGVNNPTQGIAVDPQGGVYITGYTNSTSFPQNPSVGAPAGIAASYSATAAFVTKLNPQGTGLIYSTYLSGSANIESLTAGIAIAVDSGGYAYVAGSTDDGTFPVTAGAFQTICGAYFNGTERANGCGLEAQTSGFVTKLDPTGMPAYSTFLGGRGGDIIYAIAVDTNGQAYVAGNSIDFCEPSEPSYYCFPTTGNAVLPGSASYTFVPSSNANQLFTGMAFLAVFDSNGANLLYSTYIGDNTALIANGTVASTTYGQTNASAVTVDSAGDFFLTGITAAPNLPTTAGAYQMAPAIAGCCSGFVAKFAPITPSGGASLGYLTYLSGTVNGAFPSGIVADSAGEAYVAGKNEDQNFPTTTGAYQMSCGESGDTRCNNAFVTKFNMAGTGLVWSTMLGNPLNGEGVAVNNVGSIQLDPSGNVYVTGTCSPAFADFPQVNPVQITTGGQAQPFVTEFDPTGSEILFSTFFGSGGTGSQNAAGMALDGNGNIYLAGNTAGSGVAVTTGAFQQNFVGTGDGFIAKICMVYPCGQSIGFSALPNVTYGVSPIALGAVASSGLQVSYTVSGPASVNGSTLTITGTGQVSVTASQAGNTTWAAATSVTQMFTVLPAALTVTATSPSIVSGQSIPPLTYTLSGFVNGDTATVVSGTPTESTTATAASAPGNYPVTITQGTLSAANYSFTMVDGAVTIGAYTACDVKQIGTVEVTDIQVLINEALGVLSPVHFLHGGGAVSIVDVQIVVNAALGFGCLRT